MKLTCIFARQYWNKKSSPVRRHIIQALDIHPEIDCEITGQGWANYNPSETLRANLARIQPGCEVVLLYKPYGNLRLGIPPILQPGNVDALRVIRLHEAWWDDEQLGAELMHGDVDLALCTHENDLDRVRSFGVEVDHLPQTADSNLFECDQPLSERQTPCLLAGNTSKEHYPLRHRMRQLILDGKISAAIRSPMPSWAKSKTANEDQVASYAKHLGDTRVFLACTSRHKYALGKVVEAMQAGCLVMCDPPDDSRFNSTLGRYVIPLDDDTSDGHLQMRIKSITRRLEKHGTDGSLQVIANMGKKMALAEYSHDNYCDWFLKAVKASLASR